MKRYVIRCYGETGCAAESFTDSILNAVDIYRDYVKAYTLTYKTFEYDIYLRDIETGETLASIHIDEESKHDWIDFDKN